VRKFTKKTILKTIMFAMVLVLGGCSGKGQIGDAGIEKDEQEITEIHFLEEKNSSSEDLEGAGSNCLPIWEDNMQDDYHAVINHAVKKIEAQGQLPYGGALFVGEGGCVRHGNHNFSDYKKCWDGVNGITQDGEEFESKVEVNPDRTGDQIYMVAPVSGKNEYVACFGDYKDGKYSEDWFYWLDQSFQVVRGIQSRLGAHEHMEDMMGDSIGNIHLTYEVTGLKKDYVIVSPEGEILFKKEVEGITKLCAFGKGRVALIETDFETNGQRICEANLTTGELAELALSKDEAYKEKVRGYRNVLKAVPLDERQMIICTSEGICFYDAQSRETRDAYVWSNHGIIPKSIDQMVMTNEGNLAILYKEANSDGPLFLLLKPTDKKEELKTITLATAPYNREKYKKVAALFQKEYPSYVIDIRDDYEETSLLTSLGAGNGPVLIDTAITGFEDLEKLWQPLDEFFKQTHLANEMVPNALEFGKIGDVTYGVVREFQIDMLLVPEGGPTDWDYDGFLNELENFQGAAFAHDAGADSDWRDVFFDVLENGVADNYYFNPGTGEMIFGTDKLERVLRLSQKAAKCPESENWSAVINGEALCEPGSVFTAYHAIHLRRRMETSGISLIGYPTNEGARPLLSALPPLAIRKTASEEEKEIAYTFLKLCLSKEAIEEGTSRIPVRKDVLEDEFKDYQEMVENNIREGKYRPDIDPELDWEKDTGFLYDLIENGIVQKKFPSGMQQIFDEEFGDYLDGRIDGKALSNHLKNRVHLYLEENND